MGEEKQYKNKNKEKEAEEAELNILKHQILVERGGGVNQSQVVHYQQTE